MRFFPLYSADVTFLPCTINRTSHFCSLLNASRITNTARVAMSIESARDSSSYAVAFCIVIGITASSETAIDAAKHIEVTEQWHDLTMR